MKKMKMILALALAVAMLASFAACGEAKVQEKEPDQPTKALGYIYDGDKIVDVFDGDVKIYSYEDRDEANEEIRKLLENSYKELTVADLGVPAPDLITTLKEWQTYLSTSDLIVSEMSYVDISEDIQELLDEGNLITLSFAGDWKADDFLMVMHMEDDEWCVVDPQQVKIQADGSVQVSFHHNVGLITFVTLSGEYVGSIYQPGIPNVEAESDRDIHMLTVPYFAKEELEEDLTAQMEDGHAQIAEAESLADVVEDLDQALEQMKTELKPEDLVVRDLFYIDLDQDTKDAINASGFPITLKFDLELAEDDFVMVLRYDDGKWTVIPAENVNHRDDGTTGVDFPADIGVVAVVVQKDAE